MKKIKVTMFKEFTLTCNDQKIAFDRIATRKMCGLLQMLIYHRNCISKEELIDELWQDGANPLNSLKQTVFRLRVALDEMNCFKGENVITTIKNGYQFAQDFIVETDYERVDECYRQLQDQAITKKDSIQNAEEILTLYDSFFVCDSADWSTQLRTYYHNIYEKALAIVCEEYIENNRENEALPMIEKAILMDEFYDEAYVFYMRALINLKEYNKAMEVYQRVSELYERELGRSPSMHLKSMYRIITNRDESVMDVEGLKNRLNLVSDTPIATSCDYETFKYIYKIFLSNAKRNDQEIFLLMLQLSTKESDKQQEQYIMKLKKVLSHCLRSGDVFSKINRTQIIAILPCENVNNGHSIIQRITSAFYKNTNEEKIRLHYFISPITEFDENLAQPKDVGQNKQERGTL